MRDVVAHLIDVSTRRLSFQRDGHPPPVPPENAAGNREFVAFVNSLNHQWVDAAQRLSPPMLTDLYEFVSLALTDFVESLPIDCPALFAVSWAGEESSAGWFDLGRELTEQWHHQAQIRDAVGAPPPRDAAALKAVLQIAMRVLPFAYRDTPAAPGETVVVDIGGAAGGVWSLRRERGRWTLWTGDDGTESARMTMDEDTAWRLLFNALPLERAESLVVASGDAELYRPLFGARSVIV